MNRDRDDSTAWSVFETLPQGLIITDASGAFRYANQAAAQILGMTMEALCSTSLFDPAWRVVDAQGRSMEWKDFPASEALQQRHAVKQRRIGVIQPSEDILWLEVTAGPLPEGGVAVTFQDITERRHAMSVLSREQERFQAIVDSVDGIVWEADAESFCFTYVSAKAERLLGYPIRDWNVGGFWVDHLHPQDREWAVQFCVSCTGRLEDHDFEYRFLKADGGYLWLRDIVTVSPDGTGKPRWLRGVMVDITRQKEAEAALRESEHFLREAQEAGEIGTYSWDLLGDSWRSSPTLDRIYGIDEDYPRDFDGWQTLVHPEHREAMGIYVQELIRNRGVFNREYLIQQPHGEVRWVHGRGTLFFDQDHHPIRLAGVIQDITEQKRREEEHRQLQGQLAQAQKMESLGSLAGGIAHDMNNVLGAILGMASMHETLAQPGSDLHKGMETISRACSRGRDLLQGLLSFARQQPADPQVIDLNTLVREEVALLERTTFQRIRLELALAEDLKPVLGDRAALSNALLNLCVNAVDAMPSGGSLVMRSRNDGEDSVVLEVTDTGSGMTAQTLEKAMDPFFTTKPQGKGTGLGLSIVYSTIKAHGGTFRLESAPGNGTCVHIRLPANSGKPTSLQEPEKAMTSNSVALRVLVVDDDPLMQTSLEAVLQSLGHAVELASSGREALDRLNGSLPVDLIILDMNMPSMTGAEALPHIRDLLPSTPILLATGRADQEAIDLCQRYPFVTLLPKPFSVKDLQTVLPVRRI